VIAASIGTVATMLILGLALVVERRLALDALPAGTRQPAAAAVIDALSRFFVSVTLGTIGALALLVALGAYLSGPHHYAVLALLAVLEFLAPSR